MSRSIEPLSRKELLRDLIREARLWRVSLITLGSFFGGSLEALFLLILTRASLALSSGETIEVGPAQLSTPQWLLCGLVVLFVRFLIAVWTVRASTVVWSKVGEAFRLRMFEAYLRAPWPVQSEYGRGRVQELISTHCGAAAMAINWFTSCLSSGANFLALLIVAIVVNPLASAGGLIALGLIALVLSPLRTQLHRRSAELAVANLRLAEEAAELADLALEIRIVGVRSEALTEASEVVADHRTATQRSDFTRFAIAPIYLFLAYAALLAVIGVATSISSSALPGFGAVVVILLRALSYAQGMNVGWNGVIGALPSLSVVDCEIRSMQPVAEGCLRLTADEKPSVIEFRSVSFAYGSTKVLDNVSFRIRPGERVGIAGPSGAGKSTLLELLVGLREPTSGDVLYEDQRLSEVLRSDWTTVLAFVPQTPGMRRGTLASNIRFWRSTMTDEAVMRGAQAASLFGPEERESLLEHDAGPNGSRISGGQRQRVAIARALAGDPAVVVLDEPTSALDRATEDDVSQALFQVGGSSTLVVVSHRIETLERCDRILVLNNGRIERELVPAPGERIALERAIHAPGVSG